MGYIEASGLDEQNLKWVGKWLKVLTLIIASIAGILFLLWLYLYFSLSAVDIPFRLIFILILWPFAIYAFITGLFFTKANIFLLLASIFTSKSIFQFQINRTINFVCVAVYGFVMGFIKDTEIHAVLMFALSFSGFFFTFPTLDRTARLAKEFYPATSDHSRNSN